MNRFYCATVIAVFVTVYIGTDLLLAGVSGRTTSRYSARLERGCAGSAAG